MIRSLSLFSLLLLLGACNPTPAERLAQEKEVRDSLANLLVQIKLDSVNAMTEAVVKARRDSIAQIDELIRSKEVLDSTMNANAIGTEILEAVEPTENAAKQ